MPATPCHCPESASHAETWNASATTERLARYGVTPMPPEHHLVEATVVAVEPDQDRMGVRLGPHAAVVEATRAASCLLAPRVDDRVLVSRRDDGRCYILSVLERADPTATADLSVAGHLGDTKLRTREVLHLEGSEGLRLLTRRAFQLSSRRAEIVTGSLSATAKRAIASIDDAGLVAKALDTAVERMTTRAARVFRFVSETDQTRAKHIDARAADTARISADNTVITAREVVKVDGSQVMIG